MTFLYSMPDHILVVLLRDVVRYEINIICANLKPSFDYPSTQALQSDIVGYYHYLAKIIWEIKGKPTKKRLNRRIQFDPPAEIDQWLKESRRVIVVSGHPGNREWSSIYPAMQYPGNVYALYKKIKSKLINRWMLRRRKNAKGYLIEIRKWGQLQKLIMDKPVLILMMADQNPGSDQGIT